MLKQDIEISPANSQDFEAILQLLIASSVWLQQRGINQWPVEWMQSLRDPLLAAVMAGDFFVASKEGRIAAIAELRQDPEAIWDYDPEKSIYVHKLAVDRSLRGLGYGKQMLKQIELLARARQCKSVRLDCVASNTWLGNYYTQNGFISVGAAHNGEVALNLYELRLDI